jgi:hypothetical protein
VDHIDYLPAPFNRAKKFAGGDDVVIHPDLLWAATNIEHRVPVDGTGKASRFSVRSVTINFRFGCENALPTEGKLFISPEEIMDALRL